MAITSRGKRALAGLGILALLGVGAFAFSGRAPEPIRRAVQAVTGDEPEPPTCPLTGEPTSDGHKGQKGDRNSPTVYNAAAHFAQFWDGRASDVEEQAKGPVLNPVEMAMPSEPVVVKVLESMPEYVDLFKRAFPDDPKPISYDNMAKAIGAFERGLMTPSRWDALLKGDQSALTEQEKLGFKTYTEAGCQMCHRGALLGGTSYQVLGLAKSYPRSGDPGRAKITKSESDTHAFKVPSLRNVEKTGPFFHDGQTPTLEQAVKDMAEYQLGRTLTDEQTAQIVEFLKVLTGKIDPEYIRPPVLPKSTPATPKPMAPKPMQPMNESGRRGLQNCRSQL